MGKSVKAASKVVGTTIDAMVKEGKALGKLWSALHNVKQSTKANGFDTRLGKLLVELKAQSSLDSGQISRQTLTTYGIHNIDRRRRSEALWFVENEVECRDFTQASKKGFTSLTALQAAMRKASKEAEAPSNVGQDNVVNDSGWQEPKAPKSGVTEQRSVTVHITRTKMVDTIVKQCELNNLDLVAIINDLNIELAKQAKKVA